MSPTPTVRGRTKPPLPLRLRRWVAAVFVLVLAVFLAVFITREKKPGPGPVESGAVTSQKIDAREQVHYVEFRGEKEKIEFQADRNFIGPDNMYHLVGHVQVVDFGRQGGRRVEIRCEEIIHDPNRSRFNLMGRVQMNFEEATFETETLVYTRKEDEFSTEKDILIATPRFKGSARGMRYSLKTQDLSLLGEVRLETRVSERSPLPLIILSRESTMSSTETSFAIGGAVLNTRHVTGLKGFRFFITSGDFTVTSGGTPYTVSISGLISQFAKGASKFTSLVAGQVTSSGIPAETFDDTMGVGVAEGALSWAFGFSAPIKSNGTTRHNWSQETSYALFSVVSVKSTVDSRVQNYLSGSNLPKGILEILEKKGIPLEDKTEISVIELFIPVGREVYVFGTFDGDKSVISTDPVVRLSVSYDDPGMS